MWTSIVANKVTFFLPRSADGKKKKGTQREVGNRNCYDEIHSWTVPLLIALKLQQTAKSILWTLMQPTFFDEGYFLCQKKSWQQIAVKCGGFGEFISILEGIFAESKNRQKLPVVSGRELIFSTSVSTTCSSEEVYLTVTLLHNSHLCNCIIKLNTLD